MKESDWKIFKAIKEEAIEKFCENCLAEFREVIDDESKNVHDRYLLNYKLVKNRDKLMALLFDGHSRSKATLQLLAIRGEGLASDKLVSELSDELREQTDPTKCNW